MATASIQAISHITPNHDVVRCEMFIAAPRERIFEALTDPKQVVQWWGQGGLYKMNEFRMDIRPGGKWSTVGMSCKMGATEVGGEILEVDPPKRLSYTWSSTWMPKVTTVLWELELKDGGTLVKITHSGFAGDAVQAENHSTGWNRVMVWIQSYVERGETVEMRTA